MKFIWYEDLRYRFEEILNELSEFTGFRVSPEEMKVKFYPKFSIFIDEYMLLICIYNVILRMNSSFP